MWINTACKRRQYTNYPSYISIPANDLLNHRVIVDELGRGTSTRDGLSIAIAIAEALVDSKVSIICRHPIVSC